MPEPILIQKFSLLIMGPHIFQIKLIVLTKFISACRMVWDLIWGPSSFISQTLKKVKEEEPTGAAESL